jgi:hypothetical protein
MTTTQPHAAAARLRASFAPVWLQCHAAATERAGEPDIGNDMTAEGSLGHRAMEFLLQNKEPNPLALAAEFGVLSETAEALIHAGKLSSAFVLHRDWEQVFEVALNLELGEGLPPLTGHIDRLAVSPDGRAAHIDDYKFGWADYPDPADNYQMWCYAVLAAELDFLRDRLERVYVQIHYPRQHRRTKPAVFERADLKELREAIIQAARECLGPRPSYRTGPHCERCEARFRCQALNRALSRELIIVNGADAPAQRPASLLEMTPEQAGQAVAVAKQMEDFAAEILKQAKVRVDKTGPIFLPDGSRLERVETKKTQIDLSKPGALDVLIEACGAERVLEGVKLSKTHTESAVREAFLQSRGQSRFAPGQRDSVLGGVFDRLKQAGALVETPSRSYEIKKGKSSQ